MSGLFNFDPLGDWAVAAVGVGIDVAIRAAVLLLLAWMAHAALGRARARTRSALWNACVIGLLCLPMAVVAGPRLPVALMPARAAASAEVPDAPGPWDAAGELMPHERIAQTSVEPAERASNARRPESPAMSASERSGSPTHETEATAVASAAPPVGDELSGAGRWSAGGIARGVVGIYLVVAVLLVFRLIGSLIAVRRLRSGARPVDAGRWIEARNHWAAHLGLTRAVMLLRSERLSVPVVVGVVRPAVIVPDRLVDSASAAIVEAALLHELAHVRRGDFGWNVLRKLVGAVYWAHPLAWLLGGVTGQVREQACDDLCVRHLGGGPAYRTLLLEVASGLVRRPEPALGLAMARPRNLGRRLDWIDQTRGASSCVLRRPVRWLVAVAVVAFAGLAGTLELTRAKLRAAEPQATKEKPAPRAQGVESLAEVIAALRAEEAKYGSIEYTLQVVSRNFDPKTPGAPGDLQDQDTRHVVLQGDRIWFRGQRTLHTLGAEVRQEERSAYDGELTRSVIENNCVNIHIGRFEHPDIYPAHCVSLIHYHLNFPLSVYLSGTDAIRAWPKYGQFMRESGTVYEFTKVVARVEGEEEVDGLTCVKLAVDRWHYSNDTPVHQQLWLARDRNFLCVKERMISDAKFGGLITRETRVDKLRELAPGRWFPARTTVEYYDQKAMAQQKRVVDRRTTITVAKAALNPQHEPKFFRDVEIPKDLPAFTIRNGKLVGSSFPEPIADEAEEKAKLAEVVAKLQAEEQRYADLEVKARSTYRHVGLNSMMQGTITEMAEVQHSIARGAMGFFAEHTRSTAIGGSRGQQDQVDACDGQWIRRSSRSVYDGREESLSASLRKVRIGKTEGRGDGIPVLRPHTSLLHDEWFYGPLADLLVSAWYDKGDHYGMQFRYCGEVNVDEHPCIQLRGDITVGEGRPPSTYMALCLAKDRNYIPIKFEYYGGNHGLRPIPSGTKRCDDFREIAPGLWYPFRSTLYGFDSWIDIAMRRITLNWKRVNEVESVVLSPKVDASVFHDVVLPVKTKVQVLDDARHHLGQYEQEREGVAELTPARYLAMQSEAKVRDEEQKERKRAIDALIGKPAPEFPKGATWLNEKPLTWEALRGKVVIVDFWAEWCAPCRNDFPQLKLIHDAREANGLTVIGVHPPGSEAAAIKKVIDECKLEYPMCIDIAPRDGVRAWGDLFGQFAVHAIPHAVAIDARGTIIAAGRLQDVVAKAAKAGQKR